MSTEPITPEARAAVERLLDGPVEQTERAAEERAIRFLLDGLEVGSIGELKGLVDAGRADSAEKRFMLDRAGIMSTAIGRARLALRDNDPGETAQFILDDAADELHRLHWDALLADGNDPEKIELLLGPRDRTVARPVESDVVLGRCPHGVDLDRAVCPRGCRV